MSSQPEPGPSSGRPTSSTPISRRRSSSTRTNRSRPIRPRAASSISQHSDASILSSGLQQLSWTTGDCFDYVDDDARISAFLHCPICLEPFLDPYASALCSHTFCKQCITTALTDHLAQPTQDDPLLAAAPKRCPTCRTPVELSDFHPTALLIKNMVDTLRVRCPNKSKGCEYECERHLLHSHVSTQCAYEYVDQNLTEGKRCGCSAKVMRKDWASHGQVCPKRKTRCPTCDVVLCADELEEHCEACMPEPAQCEFCGLETIKSRLTSHVADECEDAPVLCSHSAFGCGWIGPRRALQRREDSNGKSRERTHLKDECRFEPIKGFFSVFSQHVNQLKDQNIALTTRLEEVEARQRGQARRLDDCVHSLGSWYRSAGQLRSNEMEQRGVRGSQVGVDGEWDEFPLDVQNWERSWSQQSFPARQGARAYSASAVHSVDLAGWARRPYDFSAASGDWEVISPTGALPSPIHPNPAVMVDDINVAPTSSRYLAPPTARSMPTTSPLGVAAPSPSHERPPYLDSTPSSTRRSASTTLDPTTSNATTSAISPSSYGFPASSTHLRLDMDGDLDRSNLDSAISSLTASMAGLSSGLSSLDKRTEEGHIAAVKAGFDAGRVQEEVASLRHGLHAVRMQIHQILMTQQRRALFSSPQMGGVASVAAAAAAAAGGGVGGNEAGPSQVSGLAGPSVGLGGTLSALSPPLLRRWAGLEHTKL
ncbi:uncharacterized protein UHOD_03563 [Ustilago sp. UG-2017b]|nr:uncharacterized protein UHOD_03563 [Ustilago sp. UG-2017b]